MVRAIPPDSVTVAENVRSDRYETIPLAPIPPALTVAEGQKSPSGMEPLTVRHASTIVQSPTMLPPQGATCPQVLPEEPHADTSTNEMHAQVNGGLVISPGDA